MIDFFKSYSATLAPPPAMPDIGNNDPPAVLQHEGPPSLPQIIMFYHFIYSVKSDENFKTTIPSKNDDRPKTTRERGIF